MCAHVSGKRMLSAIVIATIAIVTIVIATIFIASIVIVSLRAHLHPVNEMVSRLLCILLCFVVE